jgi:antitoxin component YwqK of YwqJK toxin-antitoxin module
MNSWSRMILLCIIALSLISCAGARPRVSFDSAKVPISMSGVVLGQDGQPLGSTDQLPVGRFAAQKKGWALAYSHLPLNSMDFSEELNRQVEAIKGEAVVNLEVSINRSSCLAVGMLQLTEILPIFVGCVDVGLTGDIIRTREGVARAEAPEKERVLSARNEYGGRTVEKTYAKGEKGSNELKKQVTYFDGSGKRTMAEAFFTDTFANEKGTGKSISYFDANGKRTKAEYFHTDTFTREKGLDRSISYFDASGKTTKRELYKNGKLIKTLE